MQRSRTAAPFLQGVFIYNGKKFCDSRLLVNDERMQYCSVCFETVLKSEEFCMNLFVVVVVAEEQEDWIQQGHPFKNHTFALSRTLQET